MQNSDDKLPAPIYGADVQVLAVLKAPQGALYLTPPGDHPTYLIHPTDSLGKGSKAPVTEKFHLGGTPPRA